MNRAIPLLSLALLAGLSSGAWAQAGFGSISGKVTDQNGAVVTNAKIYITNTATNTRTEAVSNTEGYYQAFQLIPGVYRLEVEAVNFKKLDLQAVDRLAARSRAGWGDGHGDE